MRRPYKVLFLKPSALRKTFISKYGINSEAKSQYQRLKKEKEYSIVAEEIGFLGNTKDLLDTGLFLDHRPLEIRPL